MVPRLTLLSVLSLVAFVGVVSLSDLDDAKCPIGTPPAEIGEGGPDSVTSCR